MESAYMHEFLYELWRLFYEKYMCIRRITNWLFIRLLGLIDNFPYGPKKGSKTYAMVVDVAKDDPMIIHVKYWDKIKEKKTAQNMYRFVQMLNRNLSNSLHTGRMSRRDRINVLGTSNAARNMSNYFFTRREPPRHNTNYRRRAHRIGRHQFNMSSIFVRY